jgi:hypothetical protein
MSSIFAKKTSANFAATVGITLIVSAAATPAFAVDQIIGYVYNNNSYTQTSNSAPTTPFGYFFSIGAFFATPGDYSSATATYPGPASPQSLPYASSTEFNYSSPYFSSSADLQAAYPFGTYSITATGPAGTSSSTIEYNNNYFTTAIPYIQNYSSLNGLNTRQGFTVLYPSFTPDPAVTEGFTFFTIYDATTGVAVYSDEFQSPNSTSAFIAANTLSPGVTYDFELDYSDRLNGPNYVQGFDVRTDGSFSTAAVPEPSTWALMLLGVAALGCASRRQSKSELSSAA